MKVLEDMFIKKKASFWRFCDLIHLLLSYGLEVARCSYPKLSTYLPTVIGGNFEHPGNFGQSVAALSKLLKKSFKLSPHLN